MTDYYTPDAVDTLIGSIYTAEDCIKYLFNIPLNHEDSKLRTPEMMESYSDLAAACAELVAAYEHYLKAENYLCKDMNEMSQHIEEYIRRFVEEQRALKGL